MRQGEDGPCLLAFDVSEHFAKLRFSAGSVSRAGIFFMRYILILDDADIFLDNQMRERYNSFYKYLGGVFDLSGVSCHPVF